MCPFSSSKPYVLYPHVGLEFIPTVIFSGYLLLKFSSANFLVRNWAETEVSIGSIKGISGRWKMLIFLNSNFLGLRVCVSVCVSAHSVIQSRLTFWNPIVCRLPGSSVHRIFQARILKPFAISYSRQSSQPKDGAWSLASTSLPGRFLLSHLCTSFIGWFK